MQLLTSLLPLEMQLVTCDGSNVMESVCQKEKKTRQKTTLLDEEFSEPISCCETSRIDGATKKGKIKQVVLYFYCICVITSQFVSVTLCRLMRMTRSLRMSVRACNERRQREKE